MFGSYFILLLIISGGVFVLERVFPWRDQKILRDYFWRDLFFLFFNGEVFAFSLAWIELSFLGLAGYNTLISSKPLVLTDLALWLQVIIFMVSKDFIEYWIHRLLHSNNFLWSFHKIHHSVTTMDFWCNFRFHFMEIIFYKHLGFLIPLLIGVDFTAVFIGACVATAIGHLNHSNISWSYGPLKYIFNNPRMHLWHHEIRPQFNMVRNFGVVFSSWDFIFGTAYINEKVQPQIGLDDHGFTEKYPLGSFAWLIAWTTIMIYVLHM